MRCTVGQSRYSYYFLATCLREENDCYISFSSVDRPVATNLRHQEICLFQRFFPICICVGFLLKVRRLCMEILFCLIFLRCLRYSKKFCWIQLKIFNSPSPSQLKFKELGGGWGKKGRPEEAMFFFFCYFNSIVFYLLFGSPIVADSKYSQSSGSCLMPKIWETSKNLCTYVM